MSCNCWCGNSVLIRFSNEYSKCSSCGTLVSIAGMSRDELQVNDDDQDFYGKQYWLNHQSADLGFPDIHARARRDLTERNLHWIKTLLKYRLPPAKVLELGCAHGSFVALLRNAGYDASGVEMSPWVVEFGQRAFGVSILVGPLENIDMCQGDLDVIVLMDVLEHLPDPESTMRHCLNLLKPDGILLIQTPQFKEEMDYASLLEARGAFLEQLKADEHLYLFTHDSVTHLFNQLGAQYIQFEPAIFAVYDMFFVVSRQPLIPTPIDEAEEALLTTPSGRLVQAMIEMHSRINSILVDRERRLDQILKLTDLVHELKAVQVNLQDQIRMYAQKIADKDDYIAMIESDRAARLDQIQNLTRQVAEKNKYINMIEFDRADRLNQIQLLNTMIQKLQADQIEEGN